MPDRTYHEVREFSEGIPMCPLPWDNRTYLVNGKWWTCKECGMKWEPDPARPDSWIHTEIREIILPLADKVKLQLIDGADDA